MIDIHSHILPEVDDGASSWEVALAMCRMAADDGIEHMVATPHANRRYAYDREWLRGLLNELRRRAGGRPQLSLGCDFHLYSHNLDSLVHTPHTYTIEDTAYLLVEFSDAAIPPSMTGELEDMLRRGLRPIITHPERNPIVQKKPDRVLLWAQLGCAVQITASAVTGQWGSRAQQVAHWLLERKAVHLLASDAHGTEFRPPIISAARDIISRDYGQAVAEALTEHNPRAVVGGKALPYFPTVEENP